MKFSNIALLSALAGKIYNKYYKLNNNILSIDICFY